MFTMQAKLSSGLRLVCGHQRAIQNVGPEHIADRSLGAIEGDAFSGHDNFISRTRRSRRG